MVDDDDDDAVEDDDDDGARARDPVWQSSDPVSNAASRVQGVRVVRVEDVRSSGQDRQRTRGRGKDSHAQTKATVILRCGESESESDNEHQRSWARVWPERASSQPLCSPVNPVGVGQEPAHSSRKRFRLGELDMVLHGARIQGLGCRVRVERGGSSDSWP
eukprot:2553906-Rhodomonas_salina.1